MKHIEVGERYYFDFNIVEEGVKDEDDNIAVRNDGCICEVLDQMHETKYGHVFNVRNIETGDEFCAYEPELGELIGNW